LYNCIIVLYLNNYLLLNFIYLLALDGWTDPRGNSIWGFMLMTSSRKEYILNLEDLLSIKHTGQHISSVVEEVIRKIGSEKFIAIVSDNAANVASARRIISQNHPNIINIRCIAHCVNLISCDIIKIHQVKSLVRRANIITKFFKYSTLAGSWLKDAITLKNIKGGSLKTYVETRWTTVFECTSSIWRCKDALQHVISSK